ncbi:HAMP domain-containing histidine kinase, partial [bacterium]|nr:HAMP domain-containing histidine kinase [bacterium]
FNVGRTLGGILVIALPLSIFETNRYFPKYDLFGKRLIYGLVLFGGVNYFFRVVPLEVFSDVTNLFSIPFVLMLTVKASLSNVTAAKVFLFAWLAFLVGIIIWIIKNLGYLPINFLTRHIPAIGSAIEMILVGYAVALKVKKAEKRRIIALEKVKESEDLRRLLRVVCHDISNPLTMVQAAVSRRDNMDNEKAWSWVSKSAHMITEIILGVRRIEAVKTGKLEVDLERVNLSDILSQIEFIFQTKLEEKGVTLSTSVSKENLCVFANKTTLLNDVVANFVSNSIKFSKTGQNIKISVIEAENTVDITISDNGIGIPSDILVNLFDPASPTTRRGTSNEKGTGFGMPLAKSFMDEYKGNILMKSIEESDDPLNCGTQTILTLKKA